MGLVLSHSLPYPVYTCTCIKFTEMALKPVLIFILSSTMFIDSAFASECQMNSQLEKHLTQIVQDLKVLVNNYPACQKSQIFCPSCPTLPECSTTSPLGLPNLPIVHLESPSGSYKLATWGAGLTECAKYGLSMATPGLLQKAWLAGYDQCACGWLADGTVRYPVTNARPGCGGSSTGLITCSTDPIQAGRDGWDVYCSKVPITVEHHESPAGSYKLATWAEGMAECAKHGMTMATRAQLEAAWATGYDKCACGWLADGTVRYPVTNARPGCGGSSTGLITCSSNPIQADKDGWDVYCSNVQIPVVRHTSPEGVYKLPTWEAGKAECAKHGLTMATTAHLQAAVEAGYDKCACGWLADGTVRYPVTNARPGCGGSSTGLITCSNDPKQGGRDGWDVYCYTGY